MEAAASAPVSGEGAALAKRGPTSLLEELEAEAAAEAAAGAAQGAEPVEWVNMCVRKV